jgi:prepilin-type processing-associated H-X9-DG protein
MKEPTPSLKHKPVQHPQAFTLPELLIVLGCVAIVVLLILPEFARSSNVAPRINCRLNLKQIGLSFRTWALDHNNQYPMSASATNGGCAGVPLSLLAYSTFAVMSNELSTPQVLVCLQDKTRTNAATFTKFGPKNLSYFLGIDASDTNPDTLLAGDDNILVNGLAAKPGLFDLKTNSKVAWSKVRHKGQGNVGFVDGSVQQLDSTRLARALAGTGSITNRIIMP